MQVVVAKSEKIPPKWPNKIYNFPKKYVKTLQNNKTILTTAVNHPGHTK
jgi:hypothetical protein